VKPLPKHLLFVDDEPGIRAMLPIILRRYGFTVTVAETVPQALDYIKKKKFNLLLCDLNIEHKADGLQVIRAMRQMNPSCVTIVLTGYPSANSEIEGRHVGIDDYIAKPANADALVAVLAEKLAARDRRTSFLSAS
jgi:DNA-binding response OmpR family regulator